MAEGSARILLVDDEHSVQTLLTYPLRKDGFEVVSAHDGREALDRFAEQRFDLVVLDIMLPKLDGIEVCRRMRSRSQVPIIMLTAKDDEIDKVVGLELGADDYVTKPYSSRELVARIRAVLRRRGSSSSSSDEPRPENDEDDDLLVAGPVRMDVERHTVRVRGDLVPLPLKEFELLELLLRNAGRVLTRGQLIDRIWGSDYVGDTKTLDVHVKRVRAKIEDDPANPTLLVTVRGLGYKLDDDATPGA
jgi:two-component system, OmpR family, response regulator RegX3